MRPSRARRRAPAPPRAPRPIAARRPRRPALARVTPWSASISPRSSAAVDAERMRLVELGQRRRGIAGEQASSRRRMRPRSARPSISRTSAAVTLPLAMGDRLVEDRQAIAGRAFGGAGDHRAAPRARPRPLRPRRHAAKCAASLSAGMRRRSKRWQRDRTVTGTLSTSVVANRNFTCAGGSSSVFSSALNAFFDSMWTSSMM